MSDSFQNNGIEFKSYFGKINPKDKILEAAKESKGRRYPDKYQDFITTPDGDYIQDCRRIFDSKAFRRLQKKTQVITSPDNHYIRNRQQHTMEVFSVAMQISSDLGLNTFLTQAGAAGHDIGHVAYGHLGERMLSELGGKPFNHEIYGTVIAQMIESRGSGLNLTKDTLEAILNHSFGLPDAEFMSRMRNEYSAVMYADKIAYVLSDVNDAIRIGKLSEEPELAKKLGHSQRERQFRVIDALVHESKDKGFVCFSEGDTFEIFKDLRKYMTEHVYKEMDHSYERRNLEKELTDIYGFFKEHEIFRGVDPVIAMSLLDDSDARFLYDNLEKAKDDPKIIENMGMFEVIDYVRNRNIDYTKPDLDWEGIKTA